MVTSSPEKKTPVTVTRGSDPIILSQQVHWIQGTFKGQEVPNMPLIFSQKYVQCKPHNGYTEGSRFSDGRQLWTAADRPEMGRHWVWDGQSCERCPKDPIDLMKWLHCFGFNFTRVDLAIDVRNGNLQPEQATREIENGDIRTLAKDKDYHGQAGKPGYTQYVGKYSSEISLKLYNKAAEMGIDGDHTRIELTLRKKRADKAMRHIVQYRDFRGLVVAFADFPKWNEWNKAMAVTPVKLPAERKTSRTKEWLIRSGASALAKQMILDGDQKFYFEFLDAVKAFHVKMSNSQSG